MQLFSLFYYISELFCLIAGVYNVALKRFAVVYDIYVILQLAENLFNYFHKM